MKNTIIVLIALFISFSTFAQQGINYKAILKDDTGNILASSPLSVRFTIYKEDPDVPANNVYQESHTINTDVNGLIILNIGSEAVGDSFTLIKWGDSEHWLKVEINTGTGFVMMGPAIKFNAVPYALNAANVTGLEAIDESNGVGWRLKGKNPDYYGNIGENAADFSFSDAPSAIFGAIGENSTAFGRFTRATGNHSISAGSTSYASGGISFALGSGATASGPISFATGISTVASGYASSAFGYGTIASGIATTAIGNFNKADSNAHFIVGNGADDSDRKNALVVKSNGDFIIGSSQMDNDLSTPDDDSRMYFNKTKSAFRAGLIQGTLGNDAQLGMYSTAFGRNNQAISANSVALGENNSAIGLNATAIGYSNDANGLYSLALGADTEANGDYSTAMNWTTTADAYASTAIGRYNIGGGTPDDWIETDVIFEIGNSQDGNNKSNAITVLKNGTITAPSFDLAEITDDKALVTKEYLDTVAESIGFTTTNNVTSNSIGNITTDNFVFGSTQLDHDLSNNNNRRMFFDKAKGAFRIGRTQTEMGTVGDSDSWNSDNIGFLSFATGYNTKASGGVSVAMGDRCKATGDNSFSSGFLTEASGNTSTAIGDQTKASGESSTAMGTGSEASGIYSTAMGVATVARSYGETAIGNFNTDYTPIGNDYPPVGVDRVFVIGNGDSVSNRNDAIVVLQNGNATFDGEIQHTSTGNANVIPIAYGSVNGGATPIILGGTGNFTVTRNAMTNVYTISVTGETLSNNNTVVNISINTPDFRSSTVTYSGGNAIVHIFASSFAKVASPFQFVMYKE